MRYWGMFLCSTLSLGCALSIQDKNYSVATMFGFATVIWLTEEVCRKL